MTKSKSKTQTVTNRCVGQKSDELSYLQASQCQRPCRVSKIEAQSPQGDVQEGKRLVIIKLEGYNEIGELLIQNRTTGLQGHICYWDGGQRVFVTMAAVCMGVKEMGMQTGHRGAYNQPLSQE